MDALSDVLRAVRLNGAIFFDVHASDPWVAETPAGAQIVGRMFPSAEHLISYHAITRGNCWACVGAEPPLLLAPGDIVKLVGCPPSEWRQRRCMPPLGEREHGSRSRAVACRTPGGGDMRPIDLQGAAIWCMLRSARIFRPARPWPLPLRHFDWPKADTSEALRTTAGYICLIRFRGHSCSSIGQQCASSDNPCQSRLEGTSSLPLRHFVHCFLMSRS